MHIALFYPSNIGFLFGVLYGCKFLNNCKSQIIINLSIGTLAVIGLHAPLISLANQITVYLFNIEGTLCYTWYDAIPLALLIVAVILAGVSILLLLAAIRIIIQNLEGAAALGITPILIAANPASDVETSFMKIHSLSELL